MSTDDEAKFPAQDLNGTVHVISESGGFSKRTADSIDINSLVDFRVQQTLRQLLGSLLNRPSSDDAPRDHTNDTGDILVDTLNLAHQPKNRGNNSDNRTDSKGIRFVASESLKDSKLSYWADPRRNQIQTNTTTGPIWLTVNKVTLPHSVSYKMTISDRVLRDCIKECLSTFIAHTGEEAWNQDKVVLESNFAILVFNFKALSAIASERPASPPFTASNPSDETRSRLGELLEVLSRIVQPSLLMCVNHDASKNFRVEIQHVWPLFCPGKLIVANTRGYDLPQVLRIDNHHLVLDKGINTLIVSAWMWDWDGRRLVRSIYDFRKTVMGNTLVNPREWDFYPVEFYEGRDGAKGMDALLQDNLSLLNRRRLFIDYAIGYRDLVPLRYSGDALGDMTAFTSLTNTSIDDPFRETVFFRNRVGKQRSESKLIKLDEDVVLDTESYCRRVGRKRYLADRTPADAKFCQCRMCMDQNARSWYKTMDAICKAEPANVRSKIQEALNMTPDVNDYLLPPRTFGFALNKKEWCQFSLEKIQHRRKLEFSENGASVEGLIFPSTMFPEERQDIFKLVSSHKRLASHEKRFRDTIDGKGESLILLFHGHSGTGKTLYAESLAKACGLGLFRVGTNDIGLDVSQAERRLKEMFELAESWNTILLIDEADVLLDARGRENESLVSKNGLVSVLLREVEYFRGILIMTTNRVRAFDPAILSRIHHAVDFEGPSQRQEKALWDLWYERMVKDGVCGHGEDIKRWIEKTNSRKKKSFLSGREVRNVFLTAQSLAEDERKGIKIGVEELDRAYQYKLNFLDETAGKLKEAQAMVMSGMAME